MEAALGSDPHSLPWWVHCLVVVVTILVVGKGVHWAVQRATRISEHLSVSELVIGPTVVAFGTSAPEFATSSGGEGVCSWSKSDEP